MKGIRMDETSVDRGACRTELMLNMNYNAVRDGHGTMDWMVPGCVGM